MHQPLFISAITLPLFAAVVLGASACASTVADPAGTSRAALAAAPVLGTARSFAVLGGSTVTSTGATVIKGDLGVSPGLAITGFPPGLVTDGTTHAGDAVAQQAQSDVTIAFDALASEACSVDLSGQDLGGLTLTPGVYCFSSSAQLTGALTLDAGGRADAVFVFKIASTLTTASNASVALINGANDCGVFWQVGSSATLGTGTKLSGTVVALASITLTTGATVSGRTWARTGAVTMDTSAVSLPVCASTADAGTVSVIDSGIVPMDSSVAPDAGSPAIDAAIPTLDAGPVTVVDAAPAFDAGTPDAAEVDAADAAPCCSDTMCGTACVDLATDCSNCGACGHACASGNSCSLGVCKPNAN